MAKERHPIQSIYQNTNFIKGPVDISSMPPKRALKRSYNSFTSGNAWLIQYYSTVKVEFNFMDLFGYNESGTCCEIEVKMSDYDLYKEKSKEAKVYKHEQYKKGYEFCPTYFYFLVPTNLVEKCIRFCDKTFPGYGVLEIDKQDIISVRREASILTEKKFTGELLDFRGRKDRKHTFYTKEI